MADNLPALRELRKIPGVGPKIAEDLWRLGIHSLEDLKGQDPELLYQKHCEQTGRLVDRCMLYVFRCAVYYATAETYQPAMLKWWNWKDDKAGKGYGLCSKKA